MAARADAVLAGGVLQFAVQVPAVRRLGYRLRPLWSGLRSSGVHQVLLLMLPGIPVLGINQINQLISNRFASFVEGGVSYTYGAYRVTELVTELIEARDDRSLSRLKGQLKKLDLLILDELGYVPASKVGAELLFDVISQAYERTSLIVTTNLPFENWTEVLGSERLTGADLYVTLEPCPMCAAAIC